MSCLSGPPAPPPPVRVDPANVRPGTWQGWGTSLAWWANVVGERARESTRMLSLPFQLADPPPAALPICSH
jgi:hypothetical protein